MHVGGEMEEIWGPWDAQQTPKTLTREWLLSVPREHMRKKFKNSVGRTLGLYLCAGSDGATAWPIHAHFLHPAVFQNASATGMLNHRKSPTIHKGKEKSSPSPQSLLTRFQNEGDTDPFQSRSVGTTFASKQEPWVLKAMHVDVSSTTSATGTLSKDQWLLQAGPAK